MNNVVINYSDGGLGTPLSGEDFISGLIFYGASLPSGFIAATPYAEVFSLGEAEALGITAHTAMSASTITDVVHYHISEYFRANPKGDLWVYVATGASSASTYSEITTLQNASEGKLRQLGVYEQKAFATSSLNSIQSVLDTNASNNKPLECIYQGDFSSISLSSLSDLSSLVDDNVSACVGQDGGATGAALYAVIGKSIGCVGLALGTVSRVPVNQSIAWVGQNQMAATEMETLAFANGVLYNAQSDGLIENIDSKKYMFLRKFVGLSGSFWNNDYTANIETSDFTSIHLNRTIHKAARNVRSGMLPNLSSPVYFNADGSIQSYSIEHFKSVCDVALGSMLSNGEISNYKTIINAKQDVLSTKILYITIQIIPVGVADSIDISLGFVLSV
jgi:hypothetical protein